MINFFFINVHDNKDIKSISTAIIIVITISIIAINIKIPNPKSEEPMVPVALPIPPAINPYCQYCY